MKHRWIMLEIDPPEERPFLYRETTEKIIGAAFEVHRELGYGFLERVYQRALQVELLRELARRTPPPVKGVSAEIERRIQVHYKGVVGGDYDTDLIVDDVVAVELKVSSQYDKRDEAQLLNELKATGLKVGLLINFGRTKVEYKRLVF